MLQQTSSPRHIGPARLEDLRSERLFAGIGEATLAGFVRHCRLCRLDPRRVFDPRLHNGRFLYVIRRGYVTIRVAAPALEWDNFLAWRGPGQVLGEMAVLHDEPSPATIRTTDDTELLEIPAAHFVKLARAKPLLYRNIGRELVEKNFHERKRSEVIQTAPVLRQVALTLVNLTEGRGYEPGTSRINGTLRHLDIAGYIGARREAATINLGLLRTAGIIGYRADEPGKIEVLREDRLYREAYPDGPVPAILTPEDTRRAAGTR